MSYRDTLLTHNITHMTGSRAEEDKKLKQVQLHTIQH